MSYTHYWHQKKEFTVAQWSELLAAVAPILAQQNRQGVKLNYEFNEARPIVFDKDTIRFNGVGDDGHETFILTRKRPPLAPWQEHDKRNRGRAFCKTARKPYDAAVVAVLNTAWNVAPATISLGTDGDMTDGLIDQLT